jgi:chaperonin GroES
VTGEPINFRPLGPRVAVERVNPDTMSPSGLLVIPATAQTKKDRGIIVAVGTGYPQDDGTYDALELKVGDEVLFAVWGGVDLSFDGREFLVVKVEDLAGVFEPGEVEP